MTTANEQLQTELPYRDELGRLVRFVLGGFADDGLIEDVLQDVHLAAWQTSEREEIGNLRKYLRKLTRSRAAEAKRRVRRDMALALDMTETPRLDNPETLAEMRERLSQAMNILTLRQALAAKMVLIEGLSITDTANELRISRRSVEKLLHRARRVLDNFRVLPDAAAEREA